jgi:hypothetical protein
MSAPLIHDAEDSEQPCPGPESFIHLFGMLLGILPELLKQGMQTVVVGVNLSARHQGSVFREEQEDHPEQHGQQALIDLVGGMGKGMLEDASLAEVVG